MQRIDAHQHFWHFDPVRDSWITEEMTVIQRDFLPADLKPLLDKAGIDGCVAVQAVQAESENDFLLGLAKEASFIRGIVGWVDLQANDINERLAYYKQFPLVKGFRHVLQGEKDRALMLRPPFQKGIEALGRHGFTYDLLIFPDQLAFSTELVMMYPEQKFVLDHLAKPDIQTGNISGWMKDIQVLSSLPNVWCKISGMVTEADWKGWKRDDFRRVLDTTVAAFGTGRIMYGSDWPVCQVAASYSDTLGIVQDYFSSFSKSEQDAFFGGNAIQFYNL
ncbi:MAG TPA: amidohydrolase family protein [Chitinophagaceae bacterium]